MGVAEANNPQSLIAERLDIDGLPRTAAPEVDNIQLRAGDVYVQTGAGYVQTVTNNTDKPVTIAEANPIYGIPPVYYYTSTPGVFGTYVRADVPWFISSTETVAPEPVNPFQQQERKILI